MQRDAVLKVKLSPLGAHVSMKPRADHSWRDTVDADVVVGQIAGERAGELGDGTLGRGVSDSARHAEDAGGRGDGDDRTFLVLSQMRQGGPDQVKVGVDVQVHRMPPLL